MFDFDPLVSADIMHALGVDASQLANAHFYTRIKEVVDYFKNSPNPRRDILRVVQKKSGNPLDLTWTYVQLQREKERQIAKLNPEDFEVDVAAEIVRGHITKDKRERVKKDIKERMIDNIVGSTKLDVYSSALQEIDKLDKALEKFN
jgi:hypothetical protein